MVTPQTPLPNAVEQENRVSIVLNKSGTQAQNPIQGDHRWDQLSGGYIGGQGQNIRLRFSLIETSEKIMSAKSESFDSSGNIVGSINLKPLFVSDTINLVATADLIAGRDIESSDDGTRSIISVRMSSGRVMKQQIWVRNSPEDCFVINGFTSNDSNPVTVTVQAYGSAVNLSPGFFTSWNDEVGRQHGSGVTALQGTISKPYGGAQTVELFQGPDNDPFNTLVLSERPVEQANLIAFAPADGNTVQFNARFRSVVGSGDYTLCKAYVDFVTCQSAEDIAGDRTVPQIAFFGYTFPSQTLAFSFIDAGGLPSSDPEVTIHIQPLYGKIIGSDGDPHNVEDLAIDFDASDVQTFIRDDSTPITTTFSPVPDAVVVWASNVYGVDSDVLVFARDATTPDTEIRVKPSISSATYVGSGDTIGFTLDSDGGAGNNMTFDYLVIQNAAEDHTTRTGIGSIAGPSGSRNLILNSGDFPFRHCVFSLRNEQGYSNFLAIDNEDGGA